MQEKMLWENPIDDPLPAILLEAHILGALNSPNPCSLCRMVTDDIPRGHFHARDVHSCTRRVQLSMRYPKLAKSGSDPSFLQDGHMHESILLTNIANGVNRIRNIEEHLGKATVWPASSKEEIIAKIPYVTNDEVREIRIVAHFDGIILFERNSMEQTVYLLECKAVKPPKFEKIRKGEMDKEWYGQIQTYLKMLNIETAYLIVKNRENSAVLVIRIDYNSNYLNVRRDKLIEIQQATVAGQLVGREHTSKLDDECKVCPFAQQCWGSNDSVQTQMQPNVKVRTEFEEDSIFNY